MLAKHRAATQCWNSQSSGWLFRTFSMSEMIFRHVCIIESFSLCFRYRVYTVRFNLACSISFFLPFVSFSSLLNYLSFSPEYSSLWLLYIPLVVFFAFLDHLSYFFHSILLFVPSLHSALDCPAKKIHNQFPSCNALPLNSSFLPQLNFLHIYIALQCFPSGRIERISMFCHSFPQTFRGASYIAYYIACIVSRINYFENLIYQFLPLLHIHLYIYYSMVT